MKWYNPLTWFPWSRSGRQTLIYIMAALSGPALSIMVIAAGYVIVTFPDTSGEQRLDKFSSLAMIAALALLIVIIRDACFVSIRAAKIKDWIEVKGDTGEGGSPDE